MKFLKRIAVAAFAVSAAAAQGCATTDALSAPVQPVKCANGEGETVFIGSARAYPDGDGVPRGYSYKPGGTVVYATSGRILFPRDVKCGPSQ